MPERNPARSCWLVEVMFSGGAIKGWYVLAPNLQAAITRAMKAARDAAPSAGATLDRAVETVAPPGAEVLEAS